MARSLAEKLRLLPDSRALVLNAPTGYVASLDPDPAGRIDTQPAQGVYDVVQLFVTTATDLRAQLAAVRAALGPGTILWVSYPKLTSKLAGELNRDVLYGLLQDHGYQAVAQVAVDETWSAMRFKPL
jgi:hypothetical protein